MSDDRRAFFRFPTKHLVRVSVADRERFRQEYLDNISRGGCFIQTREAMTSGEAVLVVFDIAGCARFDLEGVVAHRRVEAVGQEKRQVGVGVRFTDLTPDKMRRIEDFIAGVVDGLGAGAIEVASAAAGPPDPSAAGTAAGTAPAAAEELAPATEDEPGAGQPPPGSGMPTLRMPRDMLFKLLSEAIETAAPAQRAEAPPAGAGAPDAPEGVPAAEPVDPWGEPPRSERSTDRISGELVDKLRQVASRAGGRDAGFLERLSTATAQDRPKQKLDAGREEALRRIVELSDLLERLGGRVGRRSPYEVLGCDPDQSLRVIRAVWEALTEECDPEHFRSFVSPDSLGDLERLRGAIDAAFQQLADPTSRAALDLAIGYTGRQNRSPQESEAFRACAEALRARHVRQNPDAVRRARQELEIARQREEAGDLAGAEAALEAALALDPYHLEILEARDRVRARRERKGRPGS